MPSLFISYSRTDADCARKLTESFKGQDLDFWIDWEGIPPTVDWWDEIKRGIEQAGVFLFLVSPASIQSKVCRREIDYALRNGKRLIPVVVREVNAGETPSVLSHLNWIFLRESDDFNAGFNKLITAIKTNYEWVRVHRELQSKALEWERSKQDKSFLLHGTELQLAEFQLSTNAAKEPHPTALQREYVLASRREAVNRRRLITGIASGVLIALAVLGAFGWFQAGRSTTNAREARSQRATALAESTRAFENAGTAQAASTLAGNHAATAIANAQIARAGELAAFAFFHGDERLDLSLLLSVEALKAQDTLISKSVLLNYTQMNPQLLQYMHGHRAPINRIAFSPDGKTLASGSYDSTIILWDLASQRPIGQPLTGHNSPVHSVAFSPDGKTLASASCGRLDQNNESCVEGMVILWNIETCKSNMETCKPLGQPLTGHNTWISTVAFSPNGKTLASASDTILLWDVEKHERIGPPLTRDNSFAGSLAFSPDGRLLASGMDDGTIILWDTAMQQPMGDPLTQDRGAVMLVAFSPDGETLASVTSYGNGITLWDVAKREAIQLDPGYMFSVTSLAFSPDSQTLASGGRNYETQEGFGSDIILWDIQTCISKMETCGPLGQPLTGQRGLVTSMVFQPDGTILASGSDDTAVILWELAEQYPIGQPLSGHNEPIHSIVFSPDGKTLASGGDETIMLWDIANHPPTGQTFTVDTSSARSVTFSPDGKLLAFVASENDNAIILWDVINREPLGLLPTGYPYGVGSLAFSQDGKILASGSIDSPIILWDVDKREPIGQLPTQSGYSVTSLAFSPDGRTLASVEDYQVGGTSDFTITFWDIETQQPMDDIITGHNSSITGLTFSPDGKLLASSGGWDSTIILWDVKSHRQLGPQLTGQMGDLSSVAFSPDGKLLAAARNISVQAMPGDYTILLWDVVSRQPIGLPFSGHSNPISSVVFSPDGKLLASGSGDGMIILWDLDPASWIKSACQRAGRNLTRAEWELYFPNQAYRDTCEQWRLEPLQE